MPIIVFANTKGGSGKSTSALTLGTTLARMGATDKIIDADIKQGTLSSWSLGNSKYRDLVVTPVPGEDLTDLIDRLALEFQFVIIDVQGSANEELASAMSRADLVVIPMRGKTADAEVVPKTLDLLHKQEKLFRRAIPHSVLFIATNPAIKTKEEKDIRKDVEDANIRCFQTDLNERTAFSHAFRFKLALDELSPAETNGLDRAIENANAFADEVVYMLRNDRQEVEVQ